MTALVSLGRLGPALQSIRTVPPTVAGYEPEASALFARFTTPPSVAQKTKINNRYRALKYSAAGNVLLDCDGLYFFDGEDEQSSLLNWIQSSYNCTKVNPAGITFTAGVSIQGNASTGFLTTGFNPTTAPSPKMALNSGHIGVYSLTDVLSASMYDIGNGNMKLNCRSDSGALNTLRGTANDATTASFGSPTASSVGHHVLTRGSAASRQAYREDVLLADIAQASTALSNADITILSQGAVNLSSRALRMAHYGGHLTADKVAAFRAAALL